MTVVIADPSTERLLAAAAGPVEIRDAAGRTLGLFTPGRTAEDEAYDRVIRRLDPEALARRKRESEGEPTFTYAEVLAHLRSLEGGAGGR